jgi:hypothetical protein
VHLVSFHCENGCYLLMYILMDHVASTRFAFTSVFLLMHSVFTEQALYVCYQRISQGLFSQCNPYSLHATVHAHKYRLLRIISKLT